MTMATILASLAVAAPWLALLAYIVLNEWVRRNPKIAGDSTIQAICLWLAAKSQGPLTTVEKIVPAAVLQSLGALPADAAAAPADPSSPKS